MTRTRAAVFVLVPAFLLLGISVWAQGADRWGSLGVPTMEPNFGDLRLVTATADCVRADPDWGMDSPTCDPYGRDWNYPTVWARSFAFLGLGLDRTVAVGYVMIVAFCLACAALAWVAARSELGVPAMCAGALAVLSPSGWLALERGNVDVLVFVVLAVAILLAALGRATASVPFLAVAGSWKVFPIAGAIGMVRGLRRVVLYVVVFVVSGGFALAWELPAVVDRTQRGNAYAFGAAIIPRRALAHVSISDYWTARLVGLVLVVAGMAVLLLVDRAAARRGLDSLGAVAHRIDAGAGPRALFLVGGGTFLFSYAMGSSWDYRLIFLIPVVLALGTAGSRVASVVMWGFVVAMYLSARTGSPALLADLGFLVLVPALAVIWCDVVGLPGWHRLRPRVSAVAHSASAPNPE